MLTPRSALPPDELFGCLTNHSPWLYPSRACGTPQVRRVLRLLERPFDEHAVERLAEEEAAAAAAAGGAACVRLPDYGGPVPGRYKKLCVSCSS